MANANRSREPGNAFIAGAGLGCRKRLLRATGGIWPDVHVEHLTIHDTGETWADVTEGNPWPIGIVWERLRYDWSQPGLVKGTVTDSNLFKPGSTWELRAQATNDGSSVEVIGVRHLQGRGWLLAPFFPLGLAKQTVSGHLRYFLNKVEEMHSV